MTDTKHNLKKSEARILCLLENVDDRKRFAGAIAAKLDIDYGYTLQMLHAMTQKYWLKKQQFAIKSHYFLTKTAPLEAAKELLAQ
jgi:DNA-binding MarR family transcriptional regulator